jgi:hypothetical protein
MRLVEVVDLADMLGRMGELKPDPFAMLASREARREACQCARDHANGVYSGLRYDRLVSIPDHVCHPYQYLSTIFETGCNQGRSGLDRSGDVSRLGELKACQRARTEAGRERQNYLC